MAKEKIKKTGSDWESYTEQGNKSIKWFYTLSASTLPYTLSTLPSTFCQLTTKLI